MPTYGIHFRETVDRYVEFTTTEPVDFTDQTAWFYALEEARPNWPWDQSIMQEMVDRTLLCHAEVEPKPPKEHIKAEAHSDDHAVEVEFNAVDWFEQASDKAIVALAAENWGLDYTADDVAIYCSNENKELQRMFDYIEIRNNPTQEIGFGCQVDEVTALQWIVSHRPHLMEQCSVEM